MAILQYLFIISSALFSVLLTECRSVHRPKDPLTPTISVGWLHDTKRYSLSNDHLEEYPLFKLFDQEHVRRHLLPPTAITYRKKPAQTVPGAHLSTLINHLLSEVRQKRKKYTHFDVLKKTGFNRRKGCGLLVVKFKEYPFVVKLFIETPESFVNPWSKGIEPIFFFYMGGGVNRHLSGFTRIKNLAYIRQRIDTDPQWKSYVDVPRKWFWLPQDYTQSWLDIEGKNIGSKQQQKTKIPAVYAIVADAIEAERTFSSFNKQDLQLALDITNFLEANLDLHITNFMVEKDSHKVVIIDTEHFPTIVGLKEVPTFDGYLSWYRQLIGKCGHDMLFSTKQDRRHAQKISANILAPFVSIAHETRA